MRVLLLAMLAVAQVQFEVASVKPGNAANPEYNFRATPLRVEFRDATLRKIVRAAFQLNEYQLDGGPKWLDSAVFDIDAKLPTGAPYEQMPLMLEALLVDRFKLQTHWATRTLPEYALIVGKAGPNLRPAGEDDKQHSRSSLGVRLIQGWGMTLSGLAGLLTVAAGAPVVDHTGLVGAYNISLQFAPLMGAPDDRLPDIFVAVQELGLKLEPIRGPVVVLVIDRAEWPAEN